MHPARLLNLALFLLTITPLRLVMSSYAFEGIANDRKTTKMTTTIETFTETAIGITHGSFYWYTLTYTATLTIAARDLDSAVRRSIPEATTFATSTREVDVGEYSARPSTLIKSANEDESLHVDGTLSTPTIELDESDLSIRNDGNAANSGIALKFWPRLGKCEQGHSRTYTTDCFDDGRGDPYENSNDGRTDVPRGSQTSDERSAETFVSTTADFTSNAP